MNNAHGFSQSSANLGMLLALHSDAITQAAYRLWRAKAIEFNIDEAFINSINPYSGANPVFQLATSHMKT